MRIGLICLVAAYILCQFYRAFLAVLAPVLQTDIGAGSDDLALASGVWFLTFALMQIPVGVALDSIAPRRTAVSLFALGGAGGAILFAFAQTPLHLSLAMGLIGIGCSPVLMAAYFIFARLPCSPHAPPQSSVLRRWAISRGPRYPLGRWTNSADQSLTTSRNQGFAARHQSAR